MMPIKLGRFRLIVGVIGVLTLSAAGAAPASAQGTLTGEALVCSPGADGPVTDILDNRRFCDMSRPREGSEPNVSDVECTASGGRFRYQADGIAVGPYPGTFEETGRATMGPVANPAASAARQVLTFKAEFTINTAQGEVTGRKRLTEPLPISDTKLGICLGPAGIAAATTACYEARLPDGSRDRGTSEVIVGRSVDSDALFDQFIETFTSNAELGSCGFEPETKEECKNDGFKEFDFLGFKNQGDCVSFVETEGRNEPGKNQPSEPGPEASGKSILGE